MKLRFSWVAALAATLAVTSTGSWASAQSQSTGVYNHSVRVTNQAGQPAKAAELPSGRSNNGVPQAPSPPGVEPSAAPDVDYMSNGYMPEGYPDGQCCDEGYGCNDCYSGCSSGSCCDSCGFCNMLGVNGLCGGGGGQFFATADYLYVHSSFSEATAFVAQDLQAGTDYFVPLEFDYNSSYRFGGGYRSCCCGDQIRFMFTRMTSDASATAFPGDVVPYEAAPPPGGQTRINANVDAKTFDLECAKTIPLGGCCPSSCGDACGDACGDGCCNACSPCCPAWDITWSGGVRWADVGWARRYAAEDVDQFVVTDARIGMNFQGGGLRTGLEGRRYFFTDGWLSIYGKGDISLLLGDVHLESIRDVNDPSSSVPNPVARNTQTFVTRQIIPVTELEAGLTAQVSCRTAVTAGYLFAAWHDLGFRDEHELNTLLPTRYDDANILGFDGFFARVEVGF
jgi:hypothetical protein